MNAQFGMQLNSVELMRASHEERVDILRQEFALQGKTFKNLDRRQKQMVASIFGRDVGTVARMFGEGMDLTRFQEDVGREDQMNRFIKLEERTKSAEQAVFDALKKTADKQLKAMGYGNDLNEAQLKLFAYIAENAGDVGTGLFGLGAVKSGAGAVGAVGGGVLSLIGGISVMRALGMRGTGGRIFQALAKGGGLKGRGIGILGRALGLGGSAAAGGAGGAARLINPATGQAIKFNSKRHNRLMRQGKMPIMEGTRTAANQAAKGVKPVASTAAKTVVKGGTKMGGKLIPGIGLGLALMDATSRLGRGDFVGAGIDVLAGVAGLKPGLGTAAAISLMGVNLARDANRMNEMSVQQSAQATAMGPTGTGDRMEFSDGSVMPIRVVIDELVVHSKLTFNNKTLADAVDVVFRPER